eukprot:g896.t2
MDRLRAAEAARQLVEAGSEARTGCGRRMLSPDATAKRVVDTRKWHPEGRYGIPIERIDCGDFAGKRFIPLLPGAADRLPQEIQELLKAQKALVVSLNSTKMARNGIEWQPGRDKPVAPPIDARTASIPRLDEEIKVPRFGFAELFAGLGGFRVALEALGGECRFASEIERFTRQMYELNFGATSPPVAGDIREVPDADLPEVDLLVAGFPCQPFSALGSQPAFEDDKGLLFREIVRVLNASKAKSFLLENVPGLLDCDGGRALQQIQHELQTVGLHDGQPGYAVHVRTANARNLTAQSRKRVFFFGFRKDLEAAQKPFTLPFIPELQLRAGDIFEPESKELDIYELSEEHFEGLKESQKWARRGGMTDTLAWEEKVCNTLVAHYGTSLSKGNSQLVPRPAPSRPRRFTPRECARLMGFPNSFRLTERTEPPTMWFRALYKMFGNSVSPPLVALLASAILEHLTSSPQKVTWNQLGESVALRLALEAVAPERQAKVKQMLHSSWTSESRAPLVFFICELRSRRRRPLRRPSSRRFLGGRPFGHFRGGEEHHL